MSTYSWICPSVFKDTCKTNNVRIYKNVLKIKGQYCINTPRPRKKENKTVPIHNVCRRPLHFLQHITFCTYTHSPYSLQKYNSTYHYLLLTFTMFTSPTILTSILASSSTPLSQPNTPHARIDTCARNFRNYTK